MSKCATKFCRNDAATGRSYCHKCRSRQYKQRHPEAYFFNALRNNARRRGKEFTISLEYFRGFSDATKYLEYKGRNGFNLSIDRIDNSKGYVRGNIQVMTVSENSVKSDDLPF